MSHIESVHAISFPETSVNALGVVYNRIWSELSKVYNMPDVPDKAKEIIGNVMLELEEPELIVSPLLKKTPPKGH